MLDGVALWDIVFVIDLSSWFQLHVSFSEPCPDDRFTRAPEGVPPLSYLVVTSTNSEKHRKGLYITEQRASGYALKSSFIILMMSTSNFLLRCSIILSMVSGSTIW